MEIKKGTLVLLAWDNPAGICDLGLVDEKKDNIFYLKGARPQSRYEKELIPLAQTNPKMVKTVSQALKAHSRIIIANLIALTRKDRKR